MRALIFLYRLFSFSSRDKKIYTLADIVTNDVTSVNLEHDKGPEEYRSQSNFLLILISEKAQGQIGNEISSQGT